MKLSEKEKMVLKSYLRGVLVAIVPLVTTNCTDWKLYVVAVFAGVISPALRALDKKDHAFGLVDDVAKTEIDKLLKQSK